ncbi:MAG: phage holin family protein, partial [Lachnospiraceae bacterium]|nr:phage holin family protein [Lachnospiraceae bacterium]
YIPLAALTMGSIVNILINLEAGINAAVVLGGMVSGLASTGLYEMMRNLLDKDGSLLAKK